MAVTCREGIAVLADYLEGAMSPELLQELEEHLRGCRACRAYLATYRKTRSLAADCGRVEMPKEMKARLREFLLTRLRKER
jgi:anti-sigma factor RsiW